MTRWEQHHGLTPQARLARPQNRFGPVGYLEPAEDVGDVVADRFRAQALQLGDLRVAAAPRNQTQDLPLAVG